MGMFVWLIDVLNAFGDNFPLVWLWIALLSIAAILVMVEFFRHWRRTLRPMSAALLAIGIAVAAIDLGGLMIRRLFLVWGWGPLLTLAAAGLLISRWLRHRLTDRVAPPAPRRPVICSAGECAVQEQDQEQ